MNQPWAQNYDPFGNAILSTAAAAVPVSVLFYLLAVRKAKAYQAAAAGLAAAFAMAVLVFGMPALMAGAAIGNGIGFAVVRMAWTLVAAVFVHEITVKSGQFEVIKKSLGGLTGDRRLQLVLIAFAFGSILEGSGGGGAPVAITGAMLVGLGFPPFQTVLLCLIANSGPVAYGGMGNPVRVLVAVTGMPEADLSAMLGRIVPWTTLILPFWLVRVQTTAKDTLAVWPGLLFAGASYSTLQFLWSNFGDNALVDLVSGLGTLVLFAVFLRFWQPEAVWRYPGESSSGKDEKTVYTAAQVLRAWLPFVLLGVFVVAWGMAPIAKLVESVTWRLEVPGLHRMVVRHAPVVAKDVAEPAVFEFAWLSAVGTATFLAGLIAGPLQGLSLAATLGVFAATLRRLLPSLAAVLAMLGLGYLTRYSGMDATLGLAFAHTGVLFPIFGTLIGWIGVALTGTDAGSNALFGSLQVITATKLNLSPLLMAAANSAGGVMGKMIAAQSLVVGCAATGQAGKEGDVFRAVLKHSIVLALLVALVVTVYAYVFPGVVPGVGR